MPKPFFRCLSRASLLALSALLAVACDGPILPTPIPTPTSTPVVRSTGPLAFTSSRDGSDAIYLANADGSAVTRLTNGIAPAWSPDGRQIAFQLKRIVHVINADGSGLRVVTPGDDPDWSPDGGRLAFGNSDGSSSGIGVIDTTGSNRRQIFAYGNGTFAPAWSPDGRRIAFSVGTYSDYPDASSGLWTMNSDGSEASLVRELHDGSEPAWSPDSSEIAFVSPAGIGIVRADGTGRRMMVAASNLFGMDWTPDGRLIYSRGDASAPMRIFVNQGGLERQLVPDTTSALVATYRDYLPSWSKSSR